MTTHFLYPKIQVSTGVQLGGPFYRHAKSLYICDSLAFNTIVHI